MVIRKLSLLSSCLIGLALSISSFAGNDLRFAGFASFVYTKTITSEEKEDVLYGVGEDGEYRDLNRLGLRLDTDLADRVSFTGQMVADGENNYDPEFDWIFATVELTNSLQLSVGRTMIPLFMYSDYVEVGFAYQWTRPPFSVYGVPSVRSIEGLKLRHLSQLGDWTSEFMIWGGNISEKLTENDLDTNLEVSDTVGVAWSMDREWLLLRAVYMEGKTGADITTNDNLNALINDNNFGLAGLESSIQLGIDPGFSMGPVYKDLLWEDEESYFAGIGASLNVNDFFSVIEYTRIDIDKTVAAHELESFYILLGLHLPGNWSLSYTYTYDEDTADKQTRQDFDNLLSPYAGLDPGLDALIAGLSDGIDQAVLSAQGWDAIGHIITARWNFHPQAALKFEYLTEERFRPTSVTWEPVALRLGLDLVF